MVRKVGLEPTESLPSRGSDFTKFVHMRVFGAPGWIRTYNQLILNQPALPISVQGRMKLY